MRKFRRNYTFYDVCVSAVGTIAIIEYGLWLGVALIIVMAIVGALVNE